MAFLKKSGGGRQTGLFPRISCCPVLQLSESALRIFFSLEKSARKSKMVKKHVGELRNFHFHFESRF